MKRAALYVAIAVALLIVAALVTFMVLLIPLPE